LSAEPRRRLLIASNRGPVSYGRQGGQRTVRRGGGGLVTALAGLVAAHDVTWVAAAISAEDRAVAAESARAVEERDRAGNPFRLRLLDLDPVEYDRYYNTFANPLLWFIQHGLWNHPYTPEITKATWRAWEAYESVNERFAAALAEEAAGADAIIVHDYHLYAVPSRLRALLPGGPPLLHFTHVPWPGPAGWRALPTDMREGIVRGVLGADIVGFHTARSSRAFLASCEDLLPDVAVDHGERTVRRGAERTLVRNYPISVDPDEFETFASSPEVQAAEQSVLRARPERLILRVDRTDPSKNVIRGFHALDRLLAKHPSYCGRVGMLARLDPSRQDIPDYAEYLGAIQRAAREVNDRHGTEDWQPIDLRVDDNFPETVAGYKHYDVLLVNALVDGMNLVAKEAPLVNQRDGVIVLSENTGAHEELGPWVVSVNPYDVEGTAEALRVALEMPEDDRRRRAEAVRGHVREHDVRAWVAAQLADLEALGGVA
jgi:trehalose 6-phosphate synthase